MWLQIMGNTPTIKRRTGIPDENPMPHTKEEPQIIKGDKELDHRSMCNAS